jgi:hypothetical protein
MGVMSWPGWKNSIALMPLRPARCDTIEAMRRPDELGRWLPARHSQIFGPVDSGPVACGLHRA